MRISIAMATYNGAKYLQEQLESFATQTQLPDELIVCDDGSTDKTLKILEEFSKTASFQVRIYCNENRLGPTANFGRSMSLCSGDVVFLSDQDDYWLPNKIEFICAIFESNKNTWVVINDAEITDEKLNLTGLTILGQVYSANLGTEHHIYGCCSAYRQTIIPVLLPIPAATHCHDGWLHLLGSSLLCRTVTMQCLQYYRRHGKNISTDITGSASPASRFKLFKNILTAKNRRLDPIQACEKRLLELNIFCVRLEANLDFLTSNLPFPSAIEKTLSNIDFLIRANVVRRAILLQRLPFRLPAALRFYCLGGYKSFEGLKSFAKDVLR